MTCAARPLAVFGAVGVAQHIELAHRFHAQQISAGATGLHIVLGSAGEFHAVQQEQILLRPITRHGEIIAGTGVRYSDAAGLFRREIHDAGIERQQQVVAASVQRKRLHFLLTHQAGNILRARIYHRNVVGDLHLLGDLADLEMQVGGRVLSDDQHDATADLLRKAVFVGAKFVLADGQGHKQVATASRSNGCARHSRIAIRRSDSRSRYGGAGLVGDPAGEAGGNLCVTGNRKNHANKQSYPRPTLVFQAALHELPQQLRTTGLAAALAIQTTAFNDDSQFYAV